MDRLQDFAGNASVKAAVGGMLRTGRIPHAMILEGDEGLGKRTLADFMAKAAVCAGEEAHIPCGKCKNCRLAEGGNHPDIAYIRPTGRTLSVDAIRQVRQDAYVLPHQAGRRVFIFPEADAMTEQAQNALLKVLEEPPDYVVFMLLTVSAARLLTTIRSRSTVFTLSAPGLQEAEACLLKQLELEAGDELSSGAAPAKIRELLRAQGGNIGRAKALLLAGQEPAEEQTAAALLRLAAGGGDLELLSAALPLEKDRKSARLILEALLSLIQAALTRKSGGPGSGPGNYPGEPVSTLGLSRMEQAVRAALQGLERNANLSLLSTYLCACFKEAAGL